MPLELPLEASSSDSEGQWQSQLIHRRNIIRDREGPASTLTPRNHFNHSKSHQYSQSSVPRVQKHSEFFPSPLLQQTQDMDNKTRQPRPVIFPSAAATSTARPSDAPDVYMNQRWPNEIDRETLEQANPFVFPPKKKVSLTKEALEEIDSVVKNALADSASNILAGIKADMINLVRDDIEQTSERIIIETYANIGMAINQIDQSMTAKLDKMENWLAKKITRLEGEVDMTRQLVKEELWEDLREGLGDLEREVVGLKDRLDKVPARIVDELADKGWVVTDPGSLVFGC